MALVAIGFRNPESVGRLVYRDRNKPPPEHPFSPILDASHRIVFNSYQGERAGVRASLRPHYQPPAMPWGLNRDELATIGDWHPHFAELRELPFAGGRGLFYGFLVPLWMRLPWLGKKWFALVHLTCRPSPPVGREADVPRPGDPSTSPSRTPATAPRG